MLHHFHTCISRSALPDKFTFPFHYEPHPLCIMAAEEVQAYLSTQTQWKEEISGGKMFGVLVVENEAGEIGFLAAFSGNLAHSNCHPYFVPPVFDMLNPDGFFKTEEAHISAINQQIYQLEQSSQLLIATQELQRIRERASVETGKSKKGAESGETATRLAPKRGFGRRVTGYDARKPISESGIPSTGTSLQRRHPGSPTASRHTDRPDPPIARRT
jgi:hypothetical protein